MTIAAKANLQLAIKRQSGLGVPASGAGGTGYDLLPGPRMSLAKDIIQNTIIRRDGQTKRNRHGSKSGNAAYKFPLQLGVLNPLYEAALRGTFTATFNITQATTLGGSAAATSVTTTTSTIVTAAGSMLLQGVRKGMKIKLASFTDAGNNGKWYRVINVTATVITVDAVLILNATPNSTFTITVAKYLSNPTTLTEYYHTIDEDDLDLDISSLGTDFKLSKMDFNAQPNGLLEVTFTFMGLDVAPQTSGAGSPVLTSPTYATAVVPMVMADGVIRINGVNYAILEAFQFTWDLGGNLPKVLYPTSPDVILGVGRLSGSFQALRQDLAFLTAFRSETLMDLFIDCQVPGGVNPIDFEQFYFGNVTLSGDTPPDAAQTDAGVDNVSWSGGIDDVGGASMLTSMLISSSAP